MAISVVNSKQTSGGGANSSITITAATANNILCIFYAESVSLLAPTIADSSGSGTWTVSATSAAVNTTGSLFFATKTAVGGETSITVTPGTGGTGQGISCWELSGASETVEVINATNNTASATTATTASVTTTNASDIILACIGFAAGGSGTISAWSASNSAVPTNIQTTTSRTIGSSYIPGATLSAVTETATWATSRATGSLILALQPTTVASTTTSGNLLLSGVG